MTDPILAVAPPTDTIPAPLTLQQRAEMAATALKLAKDLQRDTQFHGSYTTYRDGRVAYAAEVASSALCSIAYYAELAYKMELAATLAQVEARA